ncbi:MAG: thiamine pyrophosphate-binding protein, partial [Candidatus Binatia bacterium]
MPRDQNGLAADAVVEELARSGVRHACLAPGSRSSPLVLALARCATIRRWVMTDERAGGFFALGLARETMTPVVLLCTSGTAAANFLPAVVEAAYGNVPLVVLTADRPPELRDCGAAQTISQSGLFGPHVRWSMEAATPSADAPLQSYWRALACRAVAHALADPPG